LPAEPDEEWKHLISQVQILPPAQRGDILTALCREPSTLVLVDGYYYSVPSVTHKELLYALESGVRVLGASSMGALRAVELESFGMEGVGGVFELFRDGDLDGDDEVAVLHATEEHAYRSLTVALVDVRHVLDRWVAEGLVDAEAAQAVVTSLKELPFTQRHGSRARGLAEEHLGTGFGKRLMKELERASLKQEDARLALRLALEEPSPPQSPPKRSASTMFHGFYCEWHLRLSNGDREQELPTFLDAWSAVQILHPQALELVSALRRRFLLATAAQDKGFEPSTSRVEELAKILEARLQRLHGEPLLPALERRAEARTQARAEVAVERFGSSEAALRWLAESYGLPPEDGGDKLLQLLTEQEDLVPSWCLVRAGACCAAFRQARAVAADVRQLYHAFQVWSRGATVERQDLVQMAAGLWNCSPEDVVAQAGVRGLFESRGFSPGLWPALKLFAPAEGLKEPLNDYSHHRQELASADLCHPWL